MTDDEERAARQARLSKALSAAYLHHQITQLEDKVSHTQLHDRGQHRGSGHGGGGRRDGGDGSGGEQRDRDGRGGRRRQQGGRDGKGAGGDGAGSGGNGNSNGGGGGGGRHGSGSGNGRQRKGSQERVGGGGGSGSGINSKLSIQPDPLLSGNLARHHKMNLPPHEDVRLVVDASAWLFALPALKALLKRGAEMVVPLESLRTLDLIKKGMHPVAIAARTATRFIENAQRKTSGQHQHQVEPSRNGTTSGSGLGGGGGEKLAFQPIRPGVWIQNENEVEQILHHHHHTELNGPAIALEGDSNADGAAAAAAAADADAATLPQPPSFVQSTLGCTLFFREFWDLPSGKPILAIAHPAEEIEKMSILTNNNSNKSVEETPKHVKKDNTASGAGAGVSGSDEDFLHIIKFQDRAAGYVLKDWADKGDIEVRIITESDAKEQTTVIQDYDELDSGNVRLASLEDDPRANLEFRGRGRGRGGGRGRGVGGVGSGGGGRGGIGGGLGVPGRGRGGHIGHHIFSETQNGHQESRFKAIQDAQSGRRSDPQETQKTRQESPSPAAANQARVQRNGAARTEAETQRATLQAQAQVQRNQAQLQQAQAQAQAAQAQIQQGQAQQTQPQAQTQAQGQAPRQALTMEALERSQAAIAAMEVDAQRKAIENQIRIQRERGQAAGIERKGPVLLKRSMPPMEEPPSSPNAGSGSGSSPRTQAQPPKVVLLQRPK